MKQVFDAAVKAEEALQEPSAPILAMMAKLAALVAPDARPGIVERLIAMTKVDIDDAEGTDVQAAWAHLRHAASLERADRIADAEAEVVKAAAFVADRGSRDASRFRVHLALFERALLKKDRAAAEAQLAAARQHVPLDEMEEHPQPEFAVDLAAACARLGNVDDAFAIMDSIDEDARLKTFTEALPASTAFEREPEWARPFLARLAPLTASEHDPAARAQEVAALMRLQSRLGWKEDARASLGDAAEPLRAGEDEEEDPELDSVRADLADAAAQAGAFEAALLLIASIPDGPNLCSGMLRPLAEAGAPWRARALEIARASDRPAQALLEIASGDATRKSKEDARAALTEAESDGFEDSEWGAVARIHADLGDTAAAQAAASNLAGLEFDPLDPFGALNLDLAVQGAEAAGNAELTDELLASALAKISSQRETPQFSRPQAVANVLGTAIEIAEQRAGQK